MKAELQTYHSSGWRVQVCQEWAEFWHQPWRLDSKHSPALCFRCLIRQCSVQPYCSAGWRWRSYHKFSNDPAARRCDKNAVAVVRRRPIVEAALYRRPSPGAHAGAPLRNARRAGIFMTDRLSWVQFRAWAIRWLRKLASLWRASANCLRRL